MNNAYWLTPDEIDNIVDGLAYKIAYGKMYAKDIEKTQKLIDYLLKIKKGVSY